MKAGGSSILDSVLKSSSPDKKLIQTGSSKASPSILDGIGMSNKK